MKGKKLNLVHRTTRLSITHGKDVTAGLPLAVQVPRRCVPLAILHRRTYAIVEISKRRFFLLLTVFSVLITACTSDVVPINSTLSITPDTHSTTIVERQNENGRCLFVPDNHVDIPILLQLSTADGSPIGDATLSVYADFAANTYSENTVLSLYDDYNGNGVVDTETELVSGHTDDIARVKTDTWTGSRYLLLRINLSCSFRGEIFAFTGGVSGRASIEVVARANDN